MAQKIQQANIFGRIGTGFGKGLAEQVPKEIERSRLASGLESLAQDTSNLTPFQRFARLSAVPGITPQAIQTGGELLRQEGINQALQQRSGRKNPFKNESEDPYAVLQNRKASLSIPEKDSTPSVTTTGPVQATIKPFIPPTREQILDRAGQLAQQDPELYQGDPQKAIEGAVLEFQQEEKINQALQGQRKNQQDVQDRIERDLESRRGSANSLVPDNAYQPIRDKAIEDVVSGKLTEKQAADKYGKELVAISRDFSKVRGWGGIDLITNKPKDLFEAINSIRNKYPERQDRINFAEEMIGQNNISPQLAFSQMIPVNETEDLNNEIKSLPNIAPKLEKVLGVPGLGYGRPSGTGIRGAEDAKKKTREIAPTLLKKMGTTGSPLAVSYEIGRKGYDTDEWKSYLVDHIKELTGQQADELGLTQKGFAGWLNDWWFKSFTGVK